MRRMIWGVAALAVMAGCAATPQGAKTGGAGEILQEVKDGAIPKGYADLRVSSSLKTHAPGGYYKKDAHGTPEYKLQVSIDGKPVQLTADVRPEDREDRWRDAEGGQGVRYRFSSRVRLAAGTHRVAIAIPTDGIAVERDVTVAEGTCNSLVLEPTYRLVPVKQRPGFYGVTSFTEGIKGINVIFNDKVL